MLLPTGPTTALTAIHVLAAPCGDGDTSATSQLAKSVSRAASQDGTCARIDVPLSE